jgi:hypothetical protein
MSKFLDQEDTALAGSSVAEFKDLWPLELVETMLPFYNATNFLIDTYAIGRMLRKFDPPTGFAGLYAGDVHAENIREFFDDYLGVLPLVRESEYLGTMETTKCISLAGIDWDDLFSQHPAPE